MKNNVYVLYNTLSCRYGDVMCYPSDGFAVKRITETLKSDVLKELELCRIGTIDIDTGVLNSCAPVRIAWPEVTPSLPLND